MLFIIQIVSDVLSSIVPDKNSAATHFVFLPCSFVLSSVWPLVHSLTFYIVLLKFSFKFAAVCPSKLPFAVLQT